MNIKKIPVTILTGFLGAGKTTFLNKLLTSKEEQSIAIVVNEFGEVGVDHEIVLEAEEQIFQMNNGCVCCSLRSDIADVLFAILEAKKDHNFKLDHIIFETTGLADPGPIAQTFFNVPFLKENFEIDSVLTIVDMENILSQLRTREEPIKQISFADKIIFSKSENVPDLVKRNVISTVEKINPFVEKIMSSSNEFTIDEFIGHQLFHLTEKNIEEESETTDHHHDEHDHNDDHHHDHHHEHDDVISFAIQEQRVLSQSNTERWLQALIFTYGQDLYRYKGILNVEGIDEQIVFQGVNMSCQFYKDKDWGIEQRESTLVFIGKNIDEHDIIESFDMCLAIPHKSNLKGEML